MTADASQQSLSLRRCCTCGKIYGNTQIDGPGALTIVGDVVHNNYYSLHDSNKHDDNREQQSHHGSYPNGMHLTNLELRKLKLMVAVLNQSLPIPEVAPGSRKYKPSSGRDKKRSSRHITKRAQCLDRNLEPTQSSSTRILRSRTIHRHYDRDRRAG